MLKLEKMLYFSQKMSAYSILVNGTCAIALVQACTQANQFISAIQPAFTCSKATMEAPGEF